jgi:hypothetical protein
VRVRGRGDDLTGELRVGVDCDVGLQCRTSRNAA